jgi:hypothetical protein
MAAARQAAKIGASLPGTRQPSDQISIARKRPFCFVSWALASHRKLRVDKRSAGASNAQVGA